MPNKNNSPLVSIVLTTLNCAVFLREAIDSCLEQTYSNLELIVVDGGSNDGTLEIIACYKDHRLQLIHQQNNSGKLPGAINLGLEHAQGEYLTWMQGDSIYHPRAIEAMVDCLQVHPEVGHVYADFWQINEHGEIEKIIQTLEPDEFLAAKGDPAGVCFMIRRSVREAIGPHDIDAYPTQDYDYRMRIALRFSSLHIHEPLYYWRLHSASLTGSRPWTVDARNDVCIRLKLGLSTLQQSRRELAEIDIAYAFECYRQRRLCAVPPLILSGVKQDLHYLFNRGVWAIFLRSIAASLNPSFYKEHHAQS